MNTVTVRKKMLYCPKCKREYQDGSQRFCNNDGGRLLPAGISGKKQARQQKGVFTSLLGRAPVRSEMDEKIVPKSQVPREPRTSGQRQGFEPPVKSKIFRSERILSPELERAKLRKSETVKSQPPDQTAKTQSVKKPALRVVPSSGTPMQSPNPQEQKTKWRPTPAKPASKATAPETAKPIARLIDPSKIASGRAPLGDRSLKPTGREAVSLKALEALVGQVVKGRYKIISRLSADHSSVAYLAEDSILKGKKVVVRVLMKSPAAGSFEDKIFLEERISLSHVDHPNIAKVVDSGELPEGKSFIVTSELRGNSAEDLIQKAAELNPMRIARIVRQASYALSEVHQNGILHRNLKPEHILLTVSEAGIEQVKVTDFCVSDGTVDSENFRYKAPEQIGGQLPTFASDSYALAVVAYRLLTKSYPFDGKSERDVLAAQKAGLVAKPSELNQNLNEAVDHLFVRALSYDPSKRFPKARDFGELLFTALTAETLPSEIETEAKVVLPAEEDVSAQAAPSALNLPPADDVSIPAVGEGFNSDIHIGSTEVSIPAEEVTEENEDDLSPDERFDSNEALWQNRSPEPANERGLLWTALSLAGLVVLILGVVGVWSYFFRTTQNSPDPVLDFAGLKTSQGQGVDSPVAGTKLPESDIETPPPPRQVPAPPNTIYFENSKLNMNEEMANQFRGFSLYYPETWKRKLVDKSGAKVDDKFLDVAISDKNGIPIEHFMVSPYASNGTFKNDTELFPALVEKSNKDISGSMKGANYRVITQGVTTIQDGRWKAYEVNFELEGKMDGRPFYLWGRRLWIPIQRPGAKSGFILTMLATSLSKDVKSADDVGKKGDLKQIVQTFEPAQEF